jgi:hypothetical protein
VGKDLIVEERLVRTTLDLPRDLLERSNRVVDEGKIKSRNLLITVALAEYLDSIERAEIDAAFATMRDDDAYRRLIAGLADDFAPFVSAIAGSLASNLQ